MNDETQIDQLISGLVRKAGTGVPPHMDEKIALKAANERKQRLSRSARSLFWILVPCGASLIFGALLLFRPPDAARMSSLSEIRTQFEIVDKKITVVFYQKIRSPHIEEE